MAKGKILHVPSFFVEELAKIKLENNFKSNSPAFLTMMQRAKVGQQFERLNLGIDKEMKDLQKKMRRLQ